MFALLAALIPLIQSVGLPAVQGALAGLSIGQWLGIAEDVAKAAPEVLTAIKSLAPALHDFVTDIEEKVPHDLAAANIHADIKAWMASNGDAVIKMYPGNETP